MDDAVAKTNVKLGTTETGSAWTMKALNPATPLNVVGIPDSSCLSRVVKHFERTVTVSFPAAAANWSLDMMLHSNPWTPAAYLTFDGVTATHTPVHNTQIGVTDAAIRQFLYDQTESYRVCYASMTAIMDATSITNSGMVAATQYAYLPMDASAYYLPGGITTYATRLYDIWPDPPRAYDQLIQMPGTYVGEAKDGVYIPLRIDPELRWVNSNDVRLHVNVDDAIAGGWHTYSTAGHALPVTGASTRSWPFGMISSTDTAGALIPSLQFRNSQRTSAHVAFRNLNAGATIRFTYRMGFEFLVSPGTTYSPDLHVPPPYDPTALEAYKAVATQLKLAYPASYNDWQKIVRTISDIASTVLPWLPGGSFLAQAVPLVEKGVMAVGGRIAGRKKKPPLPKRDSPPVAKAPQPAKVKGPGPKPK
jgi:hypothetical protein